MLVFVGEFGYFHVFLVRVNGCFNASVFLGICFIEEQ